MDKKPKRSVKSWSTRDQIATELDRLAAKYEQRWSYTLDRSKLINCFCNALFKAELLLDTFDGKVLNEETLEDVVFSAIAQSREGR